MANNPIQVVLNTQNFVQGADIQGRNSNTDFYAGRDKEFIQHKQHLLEQVSNLGRVSSELEADDVLYANVELQTVALAKSHRPIKKIFDTRKQVYVGGGKLGTMIMEIVPSDIQDIENKIGSAEEETNWEIDKDNKPRAKPTTIRGEVGAIQSIRNYDASDRRKFSIQQAVDWLTDPRTGNSYYVETFVSHNSINKRNSTTKRNRALKVLTDFEERLQGLDLPIEVSDLSESWVNKAIYIIKIDNSLKDKNELLAVHTDLVKFLEIHRVVKSIILPPILQSYQVGTVENELPELSIPDPDSNYPKVGIIDTGVAENPHLNSWNIGSCEFLNDTEHDFSHGTFIAGLICSGDELNDYEELKEEKCQFYDLDLHPTKEGVYGYYYPNGFIDFLEQLNIEIPTAKENGVRVFNMSLAVESPVMDDSYSLFASIVDEMADNHNIVFVLPAGNLSNNLFRDEWPSNIDDAGKLPTSRSR